MTYTPYTPGAKGFFAWEEEPLPIIVDHRLVPVKETLVNKTYLRIYLKTLPKGFCFALIRNKSGKVVGRRYLLEVFLNDVLTPWKRIAYASKHSARRGAKRILKKYHRDMDKL